MAGLNVEDPIAAYLVALLIDDEIAVAAFLEPDRSEKARHAGTNDDEA